MDDIISELRELTKKCENKITEIFEINELNLFKSTILGKTSIFSKINKNMKELNNEDKKKIGKESNLVKAKVMELFDNKIKELKEKKIQDNLSKERIDVTLEGKQFSLGSRHILDSIIEDIEDFFISLGYEVKDGPLIENNDINFEKLNIPKNHPARDMQDSLFIDNDKLLRTHTSPVQIRTMLANVNKDELKIICPGTVFRRDEDDATHSHQFTQIEGLLLSKDVTFSDLKGTLNLLIKKLLGKDREIRLRPSYFPFTEPSVEVDVSCSICSGDGCSVCKKTGWIEILGAGMVHENVLSMCGYDSNEYRGFAFGIGVERIAMLKYGIEDIRIFYTNDLRFLDNFRRMN